MKRVSQPALASARMRPERGFTLIEVLVALAIVTIGMAALLGALSSSADSVGYLRDKTLAEWVALNRVAEVRLSLQRPTKGKTSGDVEMAGRHWTWQQEVLETEIKGILRVDVSAKPADAPGGKDKSWYTTVSGISGDALALPRGDMDPFGMPVQPGPGGQGQPNGQPNNGTLNGGQTNPTNPGTTNPVTPTPITPNPNPTN